MALHITDVLEYGGTEKDLIWKSDIVNFNTNSVVIVRPSQEAIYINNGVMGDTIESGRRQLKSENLPGLRAIKGFLGGGKTASTGEVYFFNLSVAYPLEWGTTRQIEMTDPRYKIPIRVGAGGTMHIRIGSSRKLLEKLVGMQEGFSRSQMDEFFRGIILSYLTNHLSNTLSTSEYSCLEFSRETTRLSGELKELLQEEFQNYGLILERFLIDRIMVDPEDSSKVRSLVQKHGERQVELVQDIEDFNIRKDLELAREQLEAQKKQIKIDTDSYSTIAQGHAKNVVKAEEGQVQAATNQALGISEKEKKAFDALKDLTTNVGNRTGAGEFHSYQGAFTGGVDVKIPGDTNAVSAAVLEGVKTILANEDVASGDFRQEYKKAKTLLADDYEDGTITREEYLAALEKLRDEFKNK